MTSSETALFDAPYSPSPWQPIADQVALYESTSGEQGNDFMGGLCIILSTLGAQSGTVRKTPLIRVESGGSYVVIGSLGGAPTHPQWVHNLRAEPQCRIQDGATVHDFTAREVTGHDKGHWWSIATAVWPDYDIYQAGTDRVIPLFVLGPPT